MTVDPGSGAPMSERMQSLLSRAVEDQLSEQRQLAGALAELRGQLARIAEDVASLRGAGGGAAAHADELLAGVSADVREAVRLLAERLDSVGRLVQQRGVDLVEVKSSIGELHAAVRAHSDVLTGVNGGLAALPAFGDRIGGLQDNLAALHERLGAIDEVSGAAEALQQRVDGVGQELRELRSAFTGIAARVAELPGRNDLERVTQRLDDLGAQVSALSSSLAGLDALREELAEVDVSDRLGQVDQPGPAGASSEALESLREELARFADAVLADVGRTQDRLGALDDRIAALSEAFEQKPQALGAPAAGDELGAGVAELREAVAALGEQLDGLVVEGPDEDEERIGELVAAAVSAAEARLSAHIDEAVLALAEALLRRRPRRAGGLAAPPAEPAYAAAAAPTSGVEDEAGPDDDEELEDALDEELEADVDDEPAPEPEPAEPAQWQTPVQPPQPEPEPEPARKKRPWWRPGG
jgi:prefoldin subunit 5